MVRTECDIKGEESNTKKKVIDVKQGSIWHLWHIIEEMQKPLYLAYKREGEF